MSRTQVELDWTQAPNIIAAKVFSHNPLYAIKLKEAYKRELEEYYSEWYIALHTAVLQIKDKGLIKTPKSVCIIGNRRLSDTYRDAYTRQCRASPERLRQMGEFGAKKAAKTYQQFITECHLVSEENMADQSDI